MITFGEPQRSSGIWLVVGLVIFAAVSGAFWMVYQNMTKGSIETYDQCVTAGYPVENSEPLKCVTNDGKIFVSEPGATVAPQNQTGP